MRIFNNKLVAITSIVLFMAMLALNNAHASQAVKVSLSKNPPLVFTDDSGNAAGIYVDIIKYIAEQEDWTLEFVPCKWKQCLDNAESGEIDLLMSVAFSDKRAGIFDFTNETVFNNWAMVYRKPLTQIESINDLEGEKVALVRGNILSNAFVELITSFNIQTDILEVDDYTDVFKAVDKGKATAGVVNRLSGIKFDRRFKVEKTPIIFNPIKLFFATPKGKNAELRAAIDRHMQLLKADSGSIYYQSMNKWLSGVNEVLVYEPTELKHDKPIIFAGDMAFPPIESLENGYPVGINIEILKALSEAMGRKFEIRLMQWSKAQEKVLSNEADVLTLFIPTKERRKQFDFTDTVLEFEFTFFISEDDLTIHGLNDVKGKTVGVIKAGLGNQVLKANKEIKLHIIKNTLQGFKLLKKGEINAVATTKWVGAYIIQKNKINGITIVDKPFIKNKTSIAVKKGNTKLLAELNAGILKLKQKGVIKQISNKWSGKRVIYITQERLSAYKLIIILSVLFVIALGALVWILTLRRQVKRKTFDLKKSHDNLEIKVRERTEELVRSNVELSKVFESSYVGICLVDLEGRLLKVNKQMSKIFGYTQDELVGMLVNDVTHPDYYDVSPTFIQKASSGLVLSAEFEKKYIHKNGHQIWGLVSSSLVQDDEGNPLYFISHVKDITGQKKHEEALKESEDRYRVLSEGAFEGIVIAEGGKIIDANHQMAQMLGYELSEFIGIDLAKTIAPEDWELVKKKRAEGSGEPYTHRALKKDGSVIYIEVCGKKISYKGNSVRQTVIRNVTESKKAEDKIIRSLKEKEVLLKEIHHRVKNNMAVVSSLLQLQSQHIKDPEFKEMIEESQNRIQSMALVHEKLYDSKDFTSIDVKDYIETLANTLMQTYSIHTTPIAIHMDIQAITLDIDTLIPLGLILNELITNALKHAFDGIDNCKIEVSLHSDGEDNVALTIFDNGVGLPDDINIKEIETLGLKLVGILAQQIDAKVDIDTSGGTKFTLLFKRTLEEDHRFNKEVQHLAYRSAGWYSGWIWENNTSR